MQAWRDKKLFLDSTLAVLHHGTGIEPPFQKLIKGKLFLTHRWNRLYLYIVKRSFYNYFNIFVQKEEFLKTDFN